LARRLAQRRTLYRVAFNQADVSGGIVKRQAIKLLVDIYEHWLEPPSDGGREAMSVADDHGHEHPKHELSYQAKRIYAIRDFLLEKGVISEKDIQCQIEYQEARSPANGAKLVAPLWSIRSSRQRLIADPKAACAEMGIDATAINEFVVLENTDRVRHMVVCTLCSCYPRPILGPPT
jgi:hypothetical protein